MSYDSKFSQDITNFQRYGTYMYQSDEVGNVIFNSASNNFSEVYLALPLPNFMYDNTKIVSFYDPTFTEFVPTITASVEMDTEQLQNELESQKLINVELTQQLNDLVAVNESTPSLADRMASKQVILELRKTLGQGRVDSDFSEEFPYMPLKKEANITSSVSTQPSVATTLTTTSKNSEILALSGSAPPSWFSNLQKKQEDEEKRRQSTFEGKWYRGQWYEK